MHGFADAFFAVPEVCPCPPGQGYVGGPAVDVLSASDVEWRRGVFRPTSHRLIQRLPISRHTDRECNDCEQRDRPEMGEHVHQAVSF